MNALFRRGASQSGNERNCVFLNVTASSSDRAALFAGISALSGLDFPDDGRAVATVDWDHDGDLDVWLRNRTAPKLRLMINQRTAADNAGTFVALKLTGTSCNRDAIGARVEVTLKDRSAGRLIQTLRAGDAFLSQSSKWLHFGLGADATIDAVQVRWPGGQNEQFTGVEAGGRYHLKQGTGAAVARPSSREVHLAPADQLLPAARSTAHVLMPRKIPLPELHYETSANSKSSALHQPGERPLLVVFWASWCPHCRTELESLTAAQVSLREAGIDVLALSVDQLQDSGSASAGDAAKVIAEIKFPFDHGRATATMLDRLQRLQGALFDREVSFAVPLSLLLDRQRELLAIYRGGVPLDVLQFDVKTAEVDAERRRDLAAPFAGRWYTRHRGRPVLLTTLAGEFQEKSPEVSLRYLRMALAQVDGEDALPIRTWAASLYYKIAVQRVGQGDHRGAVNYFLETVELASDFAPAHYQAALVYLQLGEPANAEVHLQRTLELEPNNNAARHRLEDLRRKR
jgi:thiol-disulfide isomerase/thioredoxin